jgi:hypothetical protein
MERYADRSGNSGIHAYEVRENAIAVEFKSDGVYLYTHESAGAEHVERMISLARAGRGLSAYISRHVKDRCAARLR